MLQVILQQNPIAQIVSLAFGAVAVFGLAGYGPLPHLAAWLAVLALLVAFRLWVIHHHGGRELDAREFLVAQRRFTAGLVLSSLTWSALPWVVATRAPEAVYFIALMIIGLMAGATVALALKPRLFAFFTLPQFASIAAYLFVADVPLGAIAAIMLLVFYAGMYKGAAIVGAEVRDYLRLQLQAEAQRNAVEGQAAKLAAANASMQRRREMLEGLLRIAVLPDPDGLRKLHRLLEFGCNVLGLRAGAIAAIRDGERQVLVAHDPLRLDPEAGRLAESLCSLALRDEEPFHFANAVEARNRLDPAYAGDVAGAYVGARIHTSEGSFGTLSFRDPVERSAPFTDAELDFVRLLAGWIGAELSEHFAQRRLRAKERQLSTLADAMPCGMAALDAKGCFVYVNRLFEHAFNPDEVSLVGRSFTDFLAAGDERILAAHLEDALAGEAQEFEYRMPARDGDEARIYRVSLLPDEGADETASGCFVLMLDITEDKARQAELELKASLDPLTRVYNRKYLEDALEKLLADRRRRKPVYVALLDLDGFKQINDTAGHDAGDAVLRDIAATLRDGLRRHDVLARYGGDEFVVLLRCVDDADLLDTCNKMLECINAKRFAFGEREFRVGMSIGATRIVHGEAMHHLLVRADSAMYLAKRRGRNRVEIVAPDEPPVKIRNQGA